MRWTISVVVVFGTGCSDHSWLFGCCKVQRIVASYTKSSYISSTRANGRNKISEDQRTKALDHARRTTANTDGRTSDGRERSRLVRDKLLPRNKRTRHREDHRGGTSTRRNARASTERTEEGEQRQRKENQNTHSHVTSRREADAGDSTLFSRRRELRKSTPPLSLEQKQKLVVDLVPRSSSPSDNNCAKTTATARRLVPKDATPTSNINHGEPIQGEISPTSSADHVALTFGLLTGFMLASSIFSFLQAALVPSEWSAVMIVCGTVTMVSGLLYSSMRETWEQVRTIPPVCRYIDWIITVPLQIVEFYLLLRTAMPPKYQVSSTL
ncbi:unnamed protein product [Amoebophrya sp. A25]|nr:unnamed protein product [Amoebophrya sp. A25]|eukprot:GSA25T00021340001.1